MEHLAVMGNSIKVPYLIRISDRGTLGANEAICTADD